MRKFFRKLVLTVFLLLVLVAAGGGMILKQGLSPTDGGPEKYVRFEGPTTRRVALTRLEKLGVIRNSSFAEVWARFSGKSAEVKRGTYRVKPGMELDEIMKSLQDPVKRMVRFREGWWIARNAERLEENEVCKADDYIRLANTPGDFRDEFKWLPAGIRSLEGYLFPDTYNFPPGTEVKDIIREQLKTFEMRVGSMTQDPKRLDRLVKVASMVELEAAVDQERPKVAGVIENRLKKGQNLEIDATVLYALQRWQVLGPGVVRTVKSPFNTYLNSGLPPGPIGSPGLASIQAAASPESHPYFYYVALPDRTHLFSRTYAEHIANIRKARAAAR